jgi:hypothetical protein
VEVYIVTLGAIWWDLLAAAVEVRMEIGVGAASIQVSRDLCTLVQIHGRGCIEETIFPAGKTGGQVRLVVLVERSMRVVGGVLHGVVVGLIES